MRDVYIVAAGSVSAWGQGPESIRRGLLSNRTFLKHREFEGIGALPVGTCEVAPVAGEDRTLTLLGEAWNQLAPTAGQLDFVPLERRGVFAASSKGAFQSMAESPTLTPLGMLDLLPDAPSRWIGNWWPSTGPRAGHVAACSTALQNIFAAAQNIAQGTIDVAVTGSTEGSLTPLYLASFLRLGALSRAGCFPYDERHSGFAAGEGAALFLLASEEVLVKSGLEPIARIRAWRAAADAWHQTSLRPDACQVKKLVEMVLRDAKLTSRDIDLISSHGTGTPQGDAAEASALMALFPERIPPVFSVKGAVGHLMGASGGIELVACAECLRAGIVPSTPGFEEAAPSCEGLPVLRHARRQSVRRILKWTLGFGGHLTACVIERP